MILECLEGMYVTYTSEIFSDPRRKKKVFVEQYLGLFLAELGLFCHFVPGLLAIALSSRLPLFIWIAGIGLGTRLRISMLDLVHSPVPELKGTVTRATFFFNLSCSIVVVQVETICCAYYRFYDQLSGNKIQCCKSAKF